MSTTTSVWLIDIHTVLHSRGTTAPVSAIAADAVAADAVVTDAVAARLVLAATVNAGEGADAGAVVDACGCLDCCVAAPAALLRSSQGLAESFFCTSGITT